jgi:hypothetical protein
MSSHPRDRAQRRAETLRICSYRQAKAKAVWKGTPEALGCFAKHYGGCNCSKHAKGRPRSSAGMCDIGRRDRIYIWRRLTKEIDLAIRQGADPYGDYVASLDQLEFPNYMCFGGIIPWKQ